MANSQTLAGITDRAWLIINAVTLGISILGVMLSTFVTGPQSIGFLGLAPYLLAAYFVSILNLAVYIPLTLMRHFTDAKKLTIVHLLFILSFCYLNIFGYISSVLGRETDGITFMLWPTVLIFVPFYIIINRLWSYFLKHPFVLRIVLLVSLALYFLLLSSAILSLPVKH
jgi:hypothetical protein